MELDVRAAVGGVFGVLGLGVAGLCAIAWVGVLVFMEPQPTGSLPVVVPITPTLPVVDGATVVDGVAFSRAEAAQALTFVNTASEVDLRRAKLYGKGVAIILSNRPFSSLEAFGSTHGVGPGTVKRVAAARR